MKPWLVNTVLDGYKLLAEHGSGSSGMVYQAENIISRQIVALKILSAQNDLAQRELAALQLFQSIDHPNLIRIHHIGQAGDQVFYTMDWCESSLVRRKVSAEELAEIAKKLTGALAELHKHGLIHRDIKPDNILFRNGEIVLGDIGLVTRGESATYAGSPGFMAPDLALGKIVPNEYTDCYALTKSLYCALSGEGPDSFPHYAGPLTPAASLIMCAALAVCAEKPKIRTAAELLAFLNQPPAPRNKKRKYLYPSLSAFLLLILIAGAGTCIIVKKETPKNANFSGTAPALQKVLPRHPRPALKKKLAKAEKESGEILALRGWNEQNRSLIPQLVSPVQRCEMEFEIEFNNRRIDLLQRRDRREISDQEFFQENRRLASLWKTARQLLKSGIGVEKLDSDYGELKEKLTIPDIGLYQQWVQADLDWQTHKQDCVKELLRRTKETGRDAADLLQEMAKKDKALQFFGIDQEKYLGEYEKIRFSGSQDAKQRSDEAIAKYLQRRKTFLQSLSRADTSVRDSAGTGRMQSGKPSGNRNFFR